jgi:perosamine synthetase
MKIPVAKPYLTHAEAKNAYDTIISGWVAQGPKVEQFEREFAEYVGSKYATAVSSCTTALHLALLVAGIKPGDEVICPSLSFIATANAIVYTGAKPVFVDIEQETYNIDVTRITSAISKKTKAVLIVHQIGMPADIDAFKRICADFKLMLIEDAACAIGSSYKGKKIGSHSSLVCFSFHPRKVITTGDGGMITTSNKNYDERLKLLRQHGMSINARARHVSKKVIFEEYVEVGYNYRMTDIQAAVGIKQLEKLDWIISERRKIAVKYNEAFKNVRCISIPLEKQQCYSNYQSYCIYLKDDAPVTRNEFIQKMLEYGISTRKGVMAIHREKAYKSYQRNTKLPITDNVTERTVILPLYVAMKNEEIEYVIEKVVKILK